MWELVIIYGISVWGAGGYNFAVMPDKKTCYETIKEAKIVSPEQDVIIYCRQYKEKE